MTKEAAIDKKKNGGVSSEEEEEEEEEEEQEEMKKMKNRKMNLGKAMRDAANPLPFHGGEAWQGEPPFDV